MFFEEKTYTFVKLKAFLIHLKSKYNNNLERKERDKKRRH